MRSRGCWDGNLLPWCWHCFSRGNWRDPMGYRDESLLRTEGAYQDEPWKWVDAPSKRDHFNRKVVPVHHISWGYVNVSLCVGKTFSPLLVCLLKGAYGIPKCYRYFVQDNGRFKTIHLNCGKTRGWTKKTCLPKGTNCGKPLHKIYTDTMLLDILDMYGESERTHDQHPVSEPPLKKHRFRRCFPFTNGRMSYRVPSQTKITSIEKQEIWLSHHKTLRTTFSFRRYSFPLSKVPVGSFKGGIHGSFCRLSKLPRFAANLLMVPPEIRQTHSLTSWDWGRLVVYHPIIYPRF